LYRRSSGRAAAPVRVLSLASLDEAALQRAAQALLVA
jgi:hypothetical protein